MSRRFGPAKYPQAPLWDGRDFFFTEQDLGKYALTVELEAAKARVTALETALEGFDLGDLEGADAALDARLDTAEGDIDTLQSDLDTAEAAAVTLAGRVTTAEGDIDALQAADTALDGRLDTVESDIAALETAMALANADGFVHFGNGSNWGTTTTRVYLRGSPDTDSACTTSPRRILFPFDVELLGAHLVGAAGTGGATITMTIRVNGVDSAKTIAVANNASPMVATEDWTGSPLAVQLSGSGARYIDVAVDKSASISATATGVGLAIAYRRTA